MTPMEIGTSSDEKFTTSCSTLSSKTRKLSVSVEACDQPVIRSEEHTSELQSQSNLVCRLLLEKKKKNKNRVRFTLYENNTAPTSFSLPSARYARCIRRCHHCCVIPLRYHGIYFRYQRSVLDQT